MTDYRSLLSALVGGVAAVAHGSARLTQDVDVVYSRKPAHIRSSSRLSLRFLPIFEELQPASLSAGMSKLSGEA